MNEPDSHSDDALDVLFALARTRRLDTGAAEYGFETRLLARLRAERSTSSIWATVSWRMAPFFAVCVLALALWHAEIASEAGDAAQVAAVENPDVVELWSNLN